MIMDDEEMVLKVTTKMLEHLGFAVVATRDGEAAIAKYRQLLDEGKTVTAIILDLTIPGGMGGRDAVHAIHRINSSAKIIASSGYSTDPIMADYQEYGFSSSITKPFNLNDLRQAISVAFASD